VRWEKKFKGIQKIHSLDNVLRGSIFEMEGLCGKENCGCAQTRIPHKPMILLFIIFQRWFVASIASSGIKG